jgi:hypothetical protein
MKLKFPLLLALITTAGLIAADAPAGGEAKKPDAPKGEGKGKGGPLPPGVTAEEWKKLGDARKAAMETPEVKAASEKAKAAADKFKAAKEEDKKAAGEEAMKARGAVREATNAAILKANPELAEIVKKAEEAMKNGFGKGGKGGKGGEGKGKPEGKPEAKPEAK